MKFRLEAELHSFEAFDTDAVQLRGQKFAPEQLEVSKISRGRHLNNFQIQPTQH